MARMQLDMGTRIALVPAEALLLEARTHEAHSASATKLTPPV